ncbi:MAG: oxidative damage protection protein [Buchnera aphidicola (Tetraneura akinire)]
MNKTIYCVYLKKKSKGLKKRVYPGILGEKIYKNISELAWNIWIKHQTIFINEKKLNMLKKEDRKILENEMKKFLFKKLFI